MQPDETRFMPSDALITRPHDAPWERLEPGQHVTVTPAGHPGAEMRVTDIIAHFDGGETYVLEDAAVTDEQAAERKREMAALFASISWCGTCCPDEAQEGAR